MSQTQQTTVDDLPSYSVVLQDPNYADSWRRNSAASQEQDLMPVPCSHSPHSSPQIRVAHCHPLPPNQNSSSLKTSSVSGNVSSSGDAYPHCVYHPMHTGPSSVGVPGAYQYSTEQGVSALRSSSSPMFPGVAARQRIAIIVMVVVCFFICIVTIVIVIVFVALRPEPML